MTTSLPPAVVLSLSTLLAAVILTSPYWVKPPYAGSSDCSPSFCYPPLDDPSSTGGEEDSAATSSSLGCGPDNWPNLPCARGVRNECGSSQGQSPIDLPGFGGGGDDYCVRVRCADGLSGVRVVDLGRCTFSDLTSSLHVGRSVQVSYPLNSGDNDEDEECSGPSVFLPHLPEEPLWELIQFHFHSGGSEHTIGGTRYDGELHLVHRSGGGSGRILVIGVILVASEDGDDDEDDGGGDQYGMSYNLEPVIAAFEGVAQRMGEECQSSPLRWSSGLEEGYSVLNSELSLEDAADGWSPYGLLPSKGDNGADEDNDDNDEEIGAFSYTGSLTTPPCTGGIEWYVLDTPQAVPSNQLSRLAALVDGGTACQMASSSGGEMPTVGAFRPTQNLGGRWVTHHCTF